MEDNRSGCGRNVQSLYISFAWCDTTVRVLNDCNLWAERGAIIHFQSNRQSSCASLLTLGSLRQVYNGGL